MPYLHADIFPHQIPKTPGGVCGDVVECFRAPEAAWVVCADGMGSGARANISANFCASLLKGHLLAGWSLRDAFRSAAAAMDASRRPGLPYAAFSVARLSPAGRATVLTYDAPPPLRLSPVGAESLPVRRLDGVEGVAGEADCRLGPGEALVLVSDGVTEAGRGAGLHGGWGVAGLCRFLSDAVVRGVPPAELSGAVCARADELCGAGPRDDTTTVVCRVRRGIVLNILTGPPADSARDRGVVERFLGMAGHRVVSGGTTASIVARVTGREPRLLPRAPRAVDPPAWALDGVDLVTEGAVTMNQAHNIMDVPPERRITPSGVSELCALMENADRVNFIVGTAANTASNDVRFQQQHILPRTVIIPLLRERLERGGRLVTVEYV